MSVRHFIVPARPMHAGAWPIFSADWLIMAFCASTAIRYTPQAICFCRCWPTTPICARCSGNPLTAPSEIAVSRWRWIFWSQDSDCKTHRHFDFIPDRSGGSDSPLRKGDDVERPVESQFIDRLLQLAVMLGAINALEIRPQFGEQVERGEILGL